MSYLTYGPIPESKRNTGVNKDIVMEFIASGEPSALVTRDDSPDLTNNAIASGLKMAIVFNQLRAEVGVVRRSGAVYLKRRNGAE